MDHDLAGLLENKDVQFAAPQIKCYLRQLLEGTFYLHQVCSFNLICKIIFEDVIFNLKFLN